ncbi:hypothetical protein C4J81_19200 (plasmid) [Deltaproteobacteria bacterium Smac51]|nr:hypothetical protein C4J81_19200 [Deltaproteobacteria bacterium Smac51]
MNIVHVAKFFPPERGGMESFVHDLAEGQAAAGHNVLVLAHAETVPADTVEYRPRLTVKRCRVVFRGGRGYAPVAPALLWEILRGFRRFGPDIIHLHCPNVAEAPVAVFPPSAPLVIQWQSDVVFPEEFAPPAWQKAVWRKIERALLSRAALVAVASPDYLQASEPLSHFRDKCRIVPLFRPAEAEPRKPGPAARWLMGRPKGRRVLSVGRLSHYKGYPVLLEAAAMAEDLSVCIIGEGEERERLELMIKRLGLSGRVLLAGAVDDGDREAALSEADLFCLPSIDRSEAFGISLLEAMRAGLPCVATRLSGSGVPFVVSHGQTGLLAAPHDAGSLAAALTAVLDDPSASNEFGVAGRKRFLEKFVPEKVLSDVDSLYNEALAGRPVGRFR